MAQCKCKVFIEKVSEELAHPEVWPAAVDEQQALEVAELGEGVVAGQHRLHALLAADAHADVGRWNGEQSTSGFRYVATEQSILRSNRTEHVRVTLIMATVMCNEMAIVMCNEIMIVFVLRCQSTSVSLIMAIVMCNEIYNCFHFEM